MERYTLADSSGKQTHLQTGDVIKFFLYNKGSSIIRIMRGNSYLLINNYPSLRLEEEIEPQSACKLCTLYASLARFTVANIEVLEQTIVRCVVGEPF